MTKSQIITQIAQSLKKQFYNEPTGHDWWHLYRVWQMAKQLGTQEKADLFIVQVAALVHDIADWKFHGNDHAAGPKAARTFLDGYKVDTPTVNHICEIIEGVSFKGAGVPTPMRTIEGKVVQDADRLDALGAIGIGRAFAYGGYRKRPMYDPLHKPVLHNNFSQYQKRSTTINHFYEKSLLLKDRFHTRTARTIATRRHRFMEQFLKQFFLEWGVEGKR